MSAKELKKRGFKFFKLLVFFCWRSNFKNSCFVFHRGFKHSKTIKALGLRPRAFISFLVFETPMKHSHSFLKYDLAFYITFPKFIRLAVLSALAFHWLTHNYNLASYLVAILAIVVTVANPDQSIHCQRLLVSPIGPKSTSITME